MEDLEPSGRWEIPGWLWVVWKIVVRAHKEMLNRLVFCKGFWFSVGLDLDFRSLHPQSATLTYQNSNRYQTKI